MVFEASYSPTIFSRGTLLEHLKEEVDAVAEAGRRSLTDRLKASTARLLSLGVACCPGLLSTRATASICASSRKKANFSSLVKT